MDQQTVKSSAAGLFEEIHPPLTDREALVEANRCLECGGPLAPAPCITACPTRINIPKFIREIREGRPLDSARTIFKANILGGTCARVCPVEVLCEGACVLNKEGRRAVEIGRLQRYSTDWALKNRANDLIAVKPLHRRKKSVGVIGAGPAGLACAAELAKLGYRVTVYERRELPGGLITYAIAPYKQLLDPLPQEVEAISKLGVEFRFGISVDEDLSIEELERKHEAIFVGIGLCEYFQMNLPGEDLEGIWDSLKFIEKLKRGRFEAAALPLGRRVAVIGGGNTAIDVAREAVRLGATDVIVLYRRTEEQMPAYVHEVQAAKREGVCFFWLTAPVKFLGDTKVKGVECTAMKLGAADTSGRPKPEPVPGTEFVLEVDSVIKALGQRPQKEFFEKLGIQLKEGLVAVNECYQTSREKYFAGGDCVNGGATVVEAVQHGKLAAQGIHQYLRKSSLQFHKKALRGTEPPGPLNSATHPTQAQDGHYYQGDFYLAIEKTFCKGCALCVNSCPTGILYLDGKGKIAVKDIEKCVFCGLCEARCPDFAIWIVKERAVHETATASSRE